MALACGHLKIEDLTPGQVWQWTSGPLGPPAPHPAFQHLAVNSCPDKQIPPMIEPHIRQIMLECSPELQVVEVNVPPGFRSEEGWRTCLRDTAEGTRIEALTREDRAIAKEIGKAMIDDKEYLHYWKVVDDWNKEKEEEIMDELTIMDIEDKEYVIVPNDYWEDGDLDDCSPRPGWEWNKGAGIPSMIRDKMAQIDSKKDAADEDMMKEMARFESETNLHLLRSTPMQTAYDGERYVRGPIVDPITNTTWISETLYLKERINCEAVVIRKPTNSTGYALAVCDYGLVHIANKFLSHVPEIEQTMQLTITVADVEEKKPFPLTAVYIH